MRKTRRHSIRLGIAVILAALFGVLLPGTANAMAQTCTIVSVGTMCTTVYGSGTHVTSIASARTNLTEPGFICEYSAWYFYVPPSGGAYGLGTEQRAGCGLVRVWLIRGINRNFEKGTLICSKFFENRWGSFIGEKCVRLT